MAPTEELNSSPIQTLNDRILQRGNRNNEPFWNNTMETRNNNFIEEEIVQAINPYEHNLHIPLLPNLKQLLITASGSDNLESVTQVKLKVISQEVGLQHLNLHLPALRELTLDGSAISSLRDLGCGLKTLKVLKVNRCGLTSLDGIYGVENLEKLYAASNYITDLTPCSFLEYIQLIDVKRNKLKDITILTYLSLCDSLEYLILEDNLNITNSVTYRQDVKKILKNLKSLDGTEFTTIDILPVTVNNYKEKVTTSNPKQRLPRIHLDKLPSSSSKCPSSAASSTSSSSSAQCSYAVSFTPKVLSPRENKESVIIKQQTDIKVEKLPKI